ncbi:MAG TPA: HK97 family phage prohead protease [Edaphobacter sp.]|nr:HK97 family phage prohead protease [Edaphobacter sp.]
MAALKKQMSVQIKALSDDGSFEGLLAVYNNVDLGQDLIEPGAFKKTIAEKGNTIPLLWQHDPDFPIGSLTLLDGADALRVKGQLLLDIQQAKTAYSLIKANVIKGLSIGYDTVKAEVENGVRMLKELRLWEGSIVTFPMNEAAMITSVKMVNGKVVESKGDFNEELAENQLRSAGYQMFDALCTALCSVTWTAGLDNSQKTDAAKMIIDQFATAYMTYFPQYLDWLAAEYGDMELMGKLQNEHKSFAGMLGRGIKTIELAREVKEGRVLSTATKKSMKEAHGHIKSADEIFNALLDDEAGDEIDDDDPNEQMGKTGDDATSETKAAGKEETEPVVDHSAAEEILAQVRSLIPKA